MATATALISGIAPQLFNYTEKRQGAGGSEQGAEEQVVGFRFNSHLTPHTSHLTPHTSHLTPHTSHLTPHTCRVAALGS